jgi:hypothetical protein
MTTPQFTIAGRFNGPKDSANGGYACGRVAAFIDGPARVRLLVPPPLDVALDVVENGANAVEVRFGDMPVARAWPAGDPPGDVPDPPTFDEAVAASRHYSGFVTHRYSTCFVCGVDRERDDGLHIFAGPLDKGGGHGTPGIVACGFTPRVELASDQSHLDPVYVWSVLDCPGGFAFPHPEDGTILLGELSVWQRAPVRVGEPHVIVAWEIDRDGRKHRTGTALFASDGECRAVGEGLWFEVFRTR